MATLDTTVGGASANSYCSLAEANTWHDSQLNTSDWTDATTDTRTQALIMATRLLDEHIVWSGEIVGSTQALQWPRLSVADRNGLYIATDVIPAWLKNAEAEFAKWLIASDRLAEQTNLEFTQLSAGPLSMALDRNYRKPVIPASIESMVQFYGTVRKNTGSIKVVRT